MRAARLAGPRNLELVDIPIPEAKDGKVVLKVTYGGICGSDVQIWENGMRTGIVLCHEFAGVVSDPGDSADFRVGDRVVAMEITPDLTCPTCQAGLINSCPQVMKEAPGIGANGGFAEYAAVRGDMLRKLPDEVSDQEAAMIEPTAIGYHALKLAKIQPGDKVLVTGNGPIGILAASSAKALGASLVVITARTEERLAFARSQSYIDASFATGDPDIHSKLQEITGGLGFDLALEATGLQEPTDLCVKALKIGGKLALVGTHGPISFNIPYLLSKAIRITGDLLFLPEDYDEIIELLATKKLDIKDAATSIITLEEVEENLIGKKDKKPGNQDVKILVKL